MKIRANEDGVITLITIEDIQDKVCEVASLPADFYETISLDKYRANADGLCINPNWTDPENTYQYFIIPTDFISDVAPFAALVRKYLPELSFNVVCKSTTIDLHDKTITVPSTVVNMSVGAVRMFDEAGYGMIYGIIYAWNALYPERFINEPFTFENYTELKKYLQTINFANYSAP